MEYTIVKISNIKRGEYTIRGAAIDNEDEPVENLDVPIIIRVYCVFQNVDQHIQTPLFTFSEIVDDEMLPSNNCSCFPNRGPNDSRIVRMMKCFAAIFIRVCQNVVTSSN